MVDFINNIDLYLVKLNGSWNGPIVYHPDATMDDFGHDWSGFTGTAPSPIAGNPNITYSLTTDTTKTYAAYIDYLNVLNLYLQNGTTNKRYFNEFIFEYENSQFARKNGGGEAAIFSANSVVRSYQGNPNLLIQGKTPLDNIPLSGSSSPIDNWDSKNDRAGWGADLFYAQIYDFINDSEYKPTWENSDSQIDPNLYNPAKAADLFTNFFTNSKIVGNPRQQINNINRMVLPQADGQTPATKFDPRANFIFSYGPDAADGPVFYSITPEQQWTWNADEFASFLTGLRTNLPPILDKIANGHGGFESGVEDFKLGVWGADRALDSWFGVPSPLELGRLRNAII